STSFLDLLLEGFVVFCGRYSQGDLSLVADTCFVHGDAHTKIAEIPVAIRFDVGFKDVAQNFTQDVITVASFGTQILLALSLPVFLLCCLKLPAFFGVSNELSALEFFQRPLNLSSRCWCSHLVDETGGDVVFGAW